MIKLSLKALLSMLLNWKRMPGRTWATEFFARVSRMILAKAAEMPIASFRKMLDNVDVSHPAVKKVEFLWSEIAGVQCMSIVPLEGLQQQRIVVYLHGGAYVTGSPRAYQPFLAQLAADSNMRVIAPDYRLSPENPFPAAQDDCLAVVRAVREANPEVALIVMGDSAGGGLSLATALDYPDIDALMLISPWVEPTADSGTVISNEANDIFTREFLDQSYASHIQDGDQFDIRVNFLNADLSKLPRTYIQVAGGELFHDQVVSFAQRARQQGTVVEMDIYPTQFHVFQVLGPILKDSNNAITKIGKFLRSIQAPEIGA